MYGEAFYGFHTAQHQLQWSKILKSSFKSKNNKSGNWDYSENVLY